MKIKINKNLKMCALILSVSAITLGLGLGLGTLIPTSQSGSKPSPTPSPVVQYTNARFVSTMVVDMKDYIAGGWIVSKIEGVESTYDPNHGYYDDVRIYFYKTTAPTKPTTKNYTITTDASGMLYRSFNRGNIIMLNNELSNGAIMTGLETDSGYNHESIYAYFSK